ncbi:CAP domain-containing protein [Demequina sp. NBRC 110052]|uniref:CAP domain-containing protein n=1 Tax=Demequina sp. NBRC 110052 TaxID=1570341 RepID=UPI00117E5F2B|nr:CAP domain-containing protein [Demequina sp. NBRC 110052]
MEPVGMESAEPSWARKKARRRRRRWILAGGAVALIAAAVIFGSIVERVPAAEEYTQRLSEALATARSDAGVAALAWNDCVAAEAAEAAEVYEASLRVEASITEVPCGDAVVVGELPIRGITSPEDAVATWTRSSYRRDIALAPDADAWGAACRTYEVDIRRYVTCSVVLVSYPS